MRFAAGIRDAASTKLGQCGRCIRLSARGAVIGWAVVGALRLLGGPLVLQSVLFAWPLSFTALWLAHVIAFAVRSVGLTRRLGLHRATDLTAPPQPSAGRAPALQMNRRLALRIFAEAAGVAVLVSFALPMRLVRACVQPPITCTSNSDCTCSGCCGQFGNGGICQPSC